MNLLDVDAANLEDFNDDSVQNLIPDGCFGLMGSVLVDGGDRYAVCATAFDTVEELVWVGNSGGHLTSYYGIGLDKYTSFQAHPSNEIRQILTPDIGVLALTKQNLKCNTRHGLNLFNYSSPSFADMQCMVFSPQFSNNTLLLGGYQQSLVTFDLHRGEETKTVSFSENNCAVIRVNDKFVFTGDTGGKIALRNSTTLQTMQILEAHSGTLSDFDICGTKLVTCGFSNRSGIFQCDRFLMIYDLRTLRAMAPLPLPFDPFCLRFMPTYSDSRLLVASQTGQFQVLELSASNNAFLHQVDTQGTFAFCMDVSPSKQCISFGDGAGILHLFSDRATPTYNECARATEFPDPVPPIHPVSFDDELFPYSLVPMPLSSDGRLLSDWPQHLCRRVYRKPLPLDPEILKSMKVSQFVGYAPNRQNRKPNQVPYDLKSTIHYPKGKSVLSNARYIRSDSELDKSENGQSLLPKCYSKVTMTYPKTIGGEELNFKNSSTNRLGLEYVVANSYVNSVLVALFHVTPLKNTLLSHLCRKEFCLSCELAFLFHMMNLTNAENRQAFSANNFVRAFRSIPEAAALGLVLNDREDASLHQANLCGLVQSFNRFILRQLSSELSDEKVVVKPVSLAISDSSFSDTAEVTPAKIFPKNIVNQTGSVDRSSSSSSVFISTPSQLNDSAFAGDSNLSEICSSNEDTIVEKLFSSKMSMVAHCKCGFETVRDSSALVFELNYSTFGTDSTSQRTSIGELLAKSVCSEQTTHAWCEKCAKFQPTSQSKRLLSLPDALSVNCNIVTDKDKDFWRNQSKNAEDGGKNWIDKSFTLRLIENGTLEFVEDTGEIVTGQSDVKSYQLLAAVFAIGWQKDGQHLVTCVRTDDEINDDKSEWIIFNDVLLTKVDVSEATSFDLDWKIPCLLMYTCVDLTQRHSVRVVSPIDERVFTLDECLSVRRRLSSSTFVPLELHELPKRGDIVALDAEFVTLNQEEAEFHSDGTKLTIKPSQLSVARVTCIRGNGPLEGVPFVDDYISTQEEVVDYLTKFSGIKPGDLNPSITSKHLTTLKSTYVKLRYLTDNGVVFVGHGLNNDFKVINIVVPSDQCIDTVNLFHLPNHRMISLKFLAWNLLGINIQCDTHDSIEDTRTALKLYKKYLELTAGGDSAFKQILNELYEKGRALKWKILPEELIS